MLVLADVIMYGSGSNDEYHLFLLRTEPMDQPTPTNRHAALIKHIFFTNIDTPALSNIVTKRSVKHFSVN